MGRYCWHVANNIRVRCSAGLNLLFGLQMNKALGARMPNRIETILANIVGATGSSMLNGVGMSGVTGHRYQKPRLVGH